MRLLLFAASLAAQAPPAPDLIITGDDYRIEATGVAVDIRDEAGIWVIRIKPKEQP